MMMLHFMHAIAKTFQRVVIKTKILFQLYTHPLDLLDRLNPNYRVANLNKLIPNVKHVCMQTLLVTGDGPLILLIKFHICTTNALAPPTGQIWR